jgi:dihydropyrimidinase
LRPGVNELQVMLPMLHSEGVLKGRISLERFVALSATNAAHLFGLYPRKGTIAVGSDADLVLWDPTETRQIRKADLLSGAGFSIYEGLEVTGWPQITIRRGEVVYEKGRVTAQPGTGQLLRRGPSQAL